MLPLGFQERMTQLLKEESQDFFTSLEQPPVTGLRVNTNKLTVQEFKDLLGLHLEPVPWCPSGFVFNDNLSGKHPFHAAGLFYFQEPSAMSVAEALQPRAGQRVIDLAAAPGGKSTHLVSLTQNKSVVIANEVTRNRVKALSENLERWGSHHAVITQQALDRFKPWQHGFDRVLLDAPCSGEGMFRKSAEALAMWSESTILGCARRQQELLHEAAQLVKAGGFLVYSTCTFAPEENEDVIADFLDKHTEFALEEITLRGLSNARSDWLASFQDLSRARRIWPHKTQGEGHFIALLKKTSGEATSLKPADFQTVSRQAQKLWDDFCQQSFGQRVLEQPLTLFGDRLYAVNEDIPTLQGIAVLKAGLWLGTVLKNRFEPSHSLALALDKRQLNPSMTLDFSADNPELLAYMQGHPLERAGDKGWVIVSVAGYPLGWGKRSGTVVNNAYPKGLRLS